MGRMRGCIKSIPSGRYAVESTPLHHPPRRACKRASQCRGAICDFRLVLGINLDTAPGHTWPHMFLMPPQRHAPPHPPEGPTSKLDIRFPGRSFRAPQFRPSLGVRKLKSSGQGGVEQVGRNNASGEISRERSRWASMARRQLAKEAGWKRHHG